MNIQEAVKTVLTKENEKKRKLFIRRKSINSGMVESDTYIYPTNGYDCCIIFNLSPLARKPENHARYWNPTADDLMANDWEIISME